MNHKIIISALLTGFSAITAADLPPRPPNIYAAGPTSPQLANVGLFASERATYALLEAAMQEAEAVIAATNCASSVGTYDLNVFSDGSVNNPNANWVIVDSPASTFTLYATLDPNDWFRGQTMSISQTVSGALKRVALATYFANVAYNAQGTMMTMNSSLKVKGINGVYNILQANVVTDFYTATNSFTGLPYIFDWGLQSLSNLGYPVQKYWQRLEALRDDGSPGRTQFVKDRLVGPTSCRIVIDTSDYNNADYFFQTGTLTISTSAPKIAYPFD